MVRAIRARKAWGHGKAAIQKLMRLNNASEIASHLHERLDTENVQVTGELFPRGTLKRRQTKFLFEWVPQYKGRLFTQQLLKIVSAKTPALDWSYPSRSKIVFWMLCQTASSSTWPFNSPSKACEGQGSRVVKHFKHAYKHVLKNSYPQEPKVHKPSKFSCNDLIYTKVCLQYVSQSVLRYIPIAVSPKPKHLAQNATP